MIGRSSRPPASAPRPGPGQRVGVDGFDVALQRGEAPGGDVPGGAGSPGPAGPAAWAGRARRRKAACGVARSTSRAAGDQPPLAVRQARVANSANTGVANSAAAVGVGARRSGNEVDQGGVGLVADGRGSAGWRWPLRPAASASSLNGRDRSSTEPPPRYDQHVRARDRAAGTGRALKPAMAAATWAAAASPYASGEGQTITWQGQRSAMRCRMSRIHRAGGAGDHADHRRASPGCEAACARPSNRPSAASLVFSRSRLRQQQRRRRLAPWSR